MALLSALLVSGARAQATSSVSSRDYASDKFDGFEAFDESKDRTPQKAKSFWYSVSVKTPDGQLTYARKMDAQGHVRPARKGYEALIREWPATPQAAVAQQSLGELFERTGKYEKAFDEYQYLLTYYSGNCPYNDILQREFKLANYLLHNNRSMFGWLLSGTDPIRERFEQIVRNAPRSSLAPEVMLIIGSIRVSEDEREEAIKVYEGLLNRFPTSPQAVSACYLAAQCRYELAVRHGYNESRSREAIAFFKAIQARQPKHPQREQMTKWMNELTALLIEQNYQRAVFYDTRQRNAEAAKAAYRRYVNEFPDSKYAQQVRDRLAELEKGAPLAK